ncbi:unnamed protein product [Periconia digitata]|uniref:Uncharacterized protein n=1 Tax=Periconia digitata TaxID=1303443 RepID=A0A9W4XLT7_9PLEO|nr:unnamed protein product [Periconia digitata]
MSIAIAHQADAVFDPVSDACQHHPPASGIVHSAVSASPPWPPPIPHVTCVCPWSSPPNTTSKNKQEEQKTTDMGRFNHGRRLLMMVTRSLCIHGTPIRVEQSRYLRYCFASRRVCRRRSLFERDFARVTQAP